MLRVLLSQEVSTFAEFSCYLLMSSKFVFSMLLKDYVKNDRLRDRAHRCASVLAKWAERGLAEEFITPLCGELAYLSRLIRALPEDGLAEEQADLYASALKKALSR